MMAKIVKGSAFKGAVDYIIDKKKDTQIVAMKLSSTEAAEVPVRSFLNLTPSRLYICTPVSYTHLWQRRREST